MKKVLVITYYWPPCGGAGVQRCLKFVKYLSQFGIQPTVITVDENKASYPVIDETLLNEVPDNIKIYRTSTSEPFGFYKLLNRKKDIPHSAFANESKPSFLQKVSRFIRGNLFIPDARVGWNKYAYKQAKSLLQNESFDAIFISTPPHSTQLLGLRLKKEFKLPWIADIRDPWTDIFFYKSMYHLGFIKKLDAKYERTVLEQADSVLVVSESIKRIFASKSNDVNADKIQVIPNGFDEEDFNVLSSPSEDSLIITYTGTLSDDYNISSFIKALAEIIIDNPTVSIKIRFVGRVSERVLDEFKSNNLSNHIEVIKYVPHNESINYLMQSTALLLVIPDIINNEGILTGKLFEYLASRKPIIGIGPEQGDAANIINECQAGSMFNYGEFDRIKIHLNDLVAHWKQNPRLDLTKDTYKKYSRKNQAEVLSKIINK